MIVTCENDICYTIASVTIMSVTKKQHTKQSTNSVGYTNLTTQKPAEAKQQKHSDLASIIHAQKI